MENLFYNAIHNPIDNKDRSEKILKNNQLEVLSMLPKYLRELRRYTFTVEVNRILRNRQKGKALELQYKNMVNKIDTIFSVVSPLEKDIVVYRGIQPSNSDKSDKFFKTDAGYISTATNIERSMKFTSLNRQCCLLVILIPKGTKVIRIPELYGFFGDEDEVLLHRDGMFVKYKNDKDLPTEYKKTKIYYLKYIPRRKISDIGFNEKYKFGIRKKISKILMPNPDVIYLTSNFVDAKFFRDTFYDENYNMKKQYFKLAFEYCVFHAAELHVKAKHEHIYDALLFFIRYLLQNYNSLPFKKYTSLKNLDNMLTDFGLTEESSITDILEGIKIYIFSIENFDCNVRNSKSYFYKGKEDKCLEDNRNDLIQHYDYDMRSISYNYFLYKFLVGKYCDFENKEMYIKNYLEKMTSGHENIDMTVKILKNYNDLILYEHVLENIELLYLKNFLQLTENILRQSFDKFLFLIFQKIFKDKNSSFDTKINTLIFLNKKFNIAPYKKVFDTLTVEEKENFLSGLKKIYRDEMDLEFLTPFLSLFENREKVI